MINIPGCAPLGDNYTETVAALLLHLNGLAPMPALDALSRPAWLFSETVHSGCNRLSYYDDGVFSTQPGEAACLVELGCWGPVVQCNVAERGVLDGHGGCMTMGGICIGCTMPGFPDRFSPMFERPRFEAQGSTRSSGGFLRRLRSARTARSRPRSPERVPAAAASSPSSSSSSRFYRAAPAAATA